MVIDFLPLLIKNVWLLKDIIKLKYIYFKLFAKLKFSQIKDCWISIFWVLYLFNLLCWSMCLVAQSYLTLCNPMDYTHQASLSMGILQARILEGVAMPSSRGSSQPRDQTQVSQIAGRFFTVWATREALVEV